MSLRHSNRIIGTFQGETPGPLVIAIGALHGNEPAGVRALELIFEALKLELQQNQDFKFRGKLLGLIGNVQAYNLRQRFIARDLNRLWTPDAVTEINTGNPEGLQAEYNEAQQLYAQITAECEAYDAEKVIFLDLHTTSADGGVFSIPSNEGESLQLAKALGAPAIIGLHEGIKGSLLSFAIEGGFCPDQKQAPVCVAFEAGQHDSEHSISRSALAILYCLRAVGCITSKVLTRFQASMNIPYLSFVPPVVRFRYAHHIEASDEFKMHPGYANFQPIQQGEHLADDVHGPVLSPEQGLILMPLYQAKGSDGFFIVQ